MLNYTFSRQFQYSVKNIENYDTCNADEKDKNNVNWHCCELK
jgi:hypothetical protein